MIQQRSNIQALSGGRNAREGIVLANQMIAFALLWVGITSSIAYLGWHNFSVEQPTRWLMLILPAMGAFLLLVAFRYYRYWQGMGTASLHLAKAAFRLNDTIKGYVEFQDIHWRKDLLASAHISLKSQVNSQKDKKEEWITKAKTHISPGNRGTRVAFSSLVRPTTDSQSNPMNYTWCLHIKLKHKNNTYKQEFKIPVEEVPEPKSELRKSATISKTPSI